jgi:hypothetical protein
VDVWLSGLWSFEHIRYHLSPCGDETGHRPAPSDFAEFANSVDLSRIVTMSDAAWTSPVSSFPGRGDRQAGASIV